MPIKDRLLSKVKVSGSCWLFTGHKQKGGYGRISTMNSKNENAHRVSYREFVGPIPVGLYVLHRCDNRACVNPDHLFLGTHADNMADMHAKGRGFRKLSDDNLAEILTSSLTDRALALKFNVTRPCITYARQRVKRAALCQNGNERAVS